MNLVERIEAIRRTGVVAVLRAPSAARAIRAVDALVEGGVAGIEITYSTPDVPDVLTAVQRSHGDGVLLGVGTVLEPWQAAQAAQAGASFLVSPGLDERVVSAMLETGATTLAGALTPTEVMRALHLGTHVVKLFPGTLVGPEYLGALRGPFPNLSVVPTGGVSPDNIGAWLRAGALAVGAGGDLVSGADIAAQRWDVIRANAERFMAALAEARAAVAEARALDARAPLSAR